MTCQLRLLYFSTRALQNWQYILRIVLKRLVDTSGRAYNPANYNLMLELPVSNVQLLTVEGENIWSVSWVCTNAYIYCVIHSIILLAVNKNKMKILKLRYEYIYFVIYTAKKTNRQNQREVFTVTDDHNYYCC